MTPKEVTVTYERTMPTVPYGNDKIKVELTASMHDGEAFSGVILFLRREAKRQVDMTDMERYEKPENG